MGTHLTVHWKPWMLCTILPSVLSLGTIMVHTTVLCTIRLAGQLYLWKEIIGRLLCTNLSLPPYLSSLISWHCNTVSTRSQSYLSSYLPHVKTELGKTTFCLRNLPFWTSSKDPWSCVLLFHWENVLTSCPFLHNSPVVTLIAAALSHTMLLTTSRLQQTSLINKALTKTSLERKREKYKKIGFNKKIKNKNKKEQSYGRRAVHIRMCLSIGLSSLKNKMASTGELLKVLCV